MPLVSLPGDPILLPSENPVENPQLADLPGIRAKNLSLELKVVLQLGVKPKQVKLLGLASEIVAVNNHFDVAFYVMETAWRALALHEPQHVDEHPRTRQSNSQTRRASRKEIS